MIKRSSTTYLYSMIRNFKCFVNKAECITRELHVEYIER